MQDTILFIGTGAADWGSPTAEKGHRRFSSSMINNDLLFDPGPHIYSYFDGTNPDKLYCSVKNVLVTHSHGDHFNPDSLLRLVKNNGKINVYGDELIRKKIPPDDNINFIPVANLEEVKVGDYKVTVLPSNHYVSDTDEQTHHYIVETPSGKRLFYGLDGAWLYNVESRVMRNNPVDMMVLDCTVGDGKADVRVFEHNTIPMVLIMTDTIKKYKAIKENGLLYVSHLAKTLHTSHDETEKRLEPYGIKVAYDGLAVQF